MSTLPKSKPDDVTMIQKLWLVLKDAARGWEEDNVTRLAAALAFYAVLSLAPLVVLATAVAGLAYGAEAARGQIATQLASVVGPSAAQGIEAVVRDAKAPESGIVTTLIGLVVLLFGASGVFIELQESLNSIWRVAPKPGRWFMLLIKDRFWSFTMVLGVALLLLTSTLLSVALAAVGHFVESALPGGEAFWTLLSFVVSLAISTLLFAVIFKVIPDVEIAWRDVWVGAGVTALLFSIGKLGIGLYLGKSSIGSSYGAAGSLVVLVIWVYYSAQIIFLGAEFTRAYAEGFGSRIRPSSGAVAIRSATPAPDRGASA